MFFVDHKKSFQCSDKPPRDDFVDDFVEKEEEPFNDDDDGLSGEDSEDPNYEGLSDNVSDEELVAARRLRNQIADDSDQSEYDEDDYPSDELRSDDSSSEDENIKKGYIGVPPGKKRKKKAKVFNPDKSEGVTKWENMGETGQQNQGEGAQERQGESGQPKHGGSRAKLPVKRRGLPSIVIREQSDTAEGKEKEAPRTTKGKKKEAPQTSKGKEKVNLKSQTKRKDRPFWMVNKREKKSTVGMEEDNLDGGYEKILKDYDNIPDASYDDFFDGGNVTQARTTEDTSHEERTTEPNQKMPTFQEMLAGAIGGKLFMPNPGFVTLGHQPNGTPCANTPPFKHGIPCDNQMKEMSNKVNLDDD
ncbi:hypothetical protein POM88_004359 [Heracleum sosnowskyi]|uniref:Uncharacterized protein n=1 Tax=Heracleum sosnowskyi TaxID=360622 RepID=A0AAD8JI82_9APIA|nr:hypothetical protein POM88_004359 [Heracleum sosnowskyi]